MRPITLLSLVALVGCSEYEWHSALDPSVGTETFEAPPADDGDGSETTVPWDGGEDPGPAFGGGSSAFRPDEPPADDPPADEGDPETPETDTPEDPGDPTTGDEEPPTDLGGDGRMTGGGSVWDGDERVTHGFQLRCDGSRSNLEINWEGGRNFHLTSITSIACWDDPTLDPLPRKAGFDTLWAVGFGKLDGVDGVPFEVLLTDDGEPGTTDTSELVIDGGAVLWASSAVDRGNHQAHGDANLEAPAGRVPTAEELAVAGLPVPNARTMGAGCSTSPGAPLAAGWILIGVLATRRRRSVG